MMEFGEQQPDNSLEPKKVFLGKRSFKVVAVNPDEDWMKENKLYVSEKEFERTGVMQIKGKPEGTTNKFAKIDVYIKDAYDEEDSEILKVSYLLQERVNVKTDGTKAQVINKYGGTLWVPVAEAKTLKLIDPMIGTSKWCDDGVKLAIVGEEGLVTFIRTLRNLNNVKYETPEDEKKKLTSLFGKADLDKMFAGNFKDISDLIKFGDTTVGFLLGARTSDKGTIYQDIYRDLPLRPYMVKTDKNEYLIKRVTEDQAAGRYSNTFFDISDLRYREYKSSNDAISPDEKENLFAGSSISNNGGFGSSENDPFAMNTTENFIEDENDDLPF